MNTASITTASWHCSYRGVNPTGNGYVTDGYLDVDVK